MDPNATSLFLANIAPMTQKVKYVNGCKYYLKSAGRIGQRTLNHLKNKWASQSRRWIDWGLVISWPTFWDKKNACVTSEDTRIRIQTYSTILSSGTQCIHVHNPWALIFEPAVENMLSQSLEILQSRYLEEWVKFTGRPLAIGGK